MKIQYIILSLILLPSFVQAADPPPTAPKMINLQAVLVDDGGNVLYEKQEADIVFSIIDGDGSTLYEEVQHVPIVNGAISVMVGRGNNVSDNQPTGGIPMEALIPDGTKLLRIKLNEQSIPQEDLQLGSVPYALYAESLSHPIESDEILDGTLLQADLSAELLTFLTDSISNTSSTAITAHRTESGAHPASSISVENTFTHSAGTNLQQILSGLDAAIGTRRNQEGEIIEDVGDEIAARVAADTAESLAREAADATEAGIREAADTALDAAKVNRAGDTMTGGLTAPSFAGDGSSLTALNATNITSGTLGDNRLTANVSLLGQSIESGEITDNAVTGDKIATNAVGSDEIGTDAVGSSEIATDAVGESEIATDAVGSSEIATDAVGSSEIATGSVGSSEIDTAAVGSDEIANGSVVPADLDLTLTHNTYADNPNDGITTWREALGFVTDSQTVGIAGDTLLGDLVFNAASDISCINASGHTCQVDGVDVSTLPGLISTAQATANSKVLKSGDTMTGSLSFNDPECPDMDLDGTPGPCFVDGVDVSALGEKVSTLECDVNPDASGCPPQPDPPPLEQTPEPVEASPTLIRAWGHVNTNNGGAVDFYSEFGFARIIRFDDAPAWIRAGDGRSGTDGAGPADGDCAYVLIFSSAMSEHNSYVITATTHSTTSSGLSDHMPIVRRTTNTYFIVETTDASDSSTCSSDLDFHVMVFGN